MKGTSLQKGGKPMPYVTNFHTLPQTGTSLALGNLTACTLATVQ